MLKQKEMTIQGLQQNVPLNLRTVNQADSVKAAEAAEQFETMLMLQMLQAMQKPLEGGSLYGQNHQSQMYGSLGDWELAKTFSKHANLGIKEQLMQNFKTVEKK